MPEPVKVRRPAPRPAPGDPDLATQVANLISRQGGADQALQLVMKENREYRERHREDTERITELEEQVPAKGSVVLNESDAKLFDSFKALTLSPAQITTALGERDTLRTANDALTARTVFAEAADKEGMKANVLTDLLTGRNMVIEMKEVTVKGADGKTSKESRAHVRPKADDKAAWETLTDFADRELKDYLPSLKAEPKAPTQDGTPFLPQTGGDRTAPRPATPAAAVESVLQSTFMTPSQRNAKQSQ